MGFWFMEFQVGPGEKNLHSKNVPGDSDGQPSWKHFILRIEANGNHDSGV